MLVFQNKGLIDLAAVTTMGVSAKETSNPIGMFGTGLKYAAAIFARNGVKMTIYRGAERHEFGTTKQEIRGQNFDIVTLNGEKLGFTTELGKNWELWQAFREVYCNCLDEGGDAMETNEPVLLAGCTTITLGGPGLDAIWAKRGTIILQTTPLYTMPGLELHPGVSQYIYYRGVRVGTLDYPSQWTYNLTNTQPLTEDRTLANGVSSLKHDLGHTMARHAPEAVVRRVVLAPENTWEQGFRYSWCGHASEQFLRVVKELAKTRGVSQSAVNLMYELTKSAPDYAPTELSALSNRDLKDAVKLCEKLGYDVTEFPVTVTDELDEGTLGIARLDTKQIVLSTRVFKQGLRMVAGTLLEEHIHLKYGLADCSRELQNHLLDTLMECAAKLPKRRRKAA
jgi:hypothetical protein